MDEEVFWQGDDNVTVLSRRVDVMRLEFVPLKAAVLDCIAVRLLEHAAQQRLGVL